uniref:Uncharacterized protein n=1 Tax=Manihot esculenta TaxID=3983 RepID=A0A2C9UDW8_MANES
MITRANITTIKKPERSIPSSSGTTIVIFPIAATVPCVFFLISVYL